MQPSVCFPSCFPSCTQISQIFLSGFRSVFLHYICIWLPLSMGRMSSRSTLIVPFIPVFAARVRQYSAMNFIVLPRSSLHIICGSRSAYTIYNLVFVCSISAHNLKVSCRTVWLLVASICKCLISIQFQPIVINALFAVCLLLAGLGVKCLSVFRRSIPIFFSTVIFRPHYWHFVFPCFASITTSSPFVNFQLHHFRVLCRADWLVSVSCVCKCLQGPLWHSMIPPCSHQHTNGIRK